MTPIERMLGLMFPTAAWKAVLLALLVAAPAAAAPQPRVTDFDVAKTQTWADALALCDLTAFLQSRPDLDADVIMAPDGRSEWLRPLYAPRFLPQGLFYDHNVRLAFERLERAGEVDRRAFGEARARHDRPLFRSFERARKAELEFLAEQSRLCAALVADVRSRYR
jgi:hypothetical protein